MIVRRAINRLSQDQLRDIVATLVYGLYLDWDDEAEQEVWNTEKDVVSADFMLTMNLVLAKHGIADAADLAAEYMTTAEAAEAWGVPQYTVGDFCRRGRVPGAKIADGGYAVPRSAAKPTDLRESNPGEGYMTTAEYARLCGVSRARVHQWVKEGRIPALRMPGTTARGIFAIPANTPAVARRGGRKKKKNVR